MFVKRIPENGLPTVFIGKKSTPAMILFLAALLSLGGCDALFDHALDCIDSDGPKFNKRILASPVLNEVYQETIIASIDNEPRDNNFDYTISLRGALPTGITGAQQGGGSRQFFFDGTPTELGTFEFDLSVVVDDPNDLSEQGSGLCYTSRTDTYELTVLPM